MILVHTYNIMKNKIKYFFKSGYYHFGNKYSSIKYSLDRKLRKKKEYGQLCEYLDDFVTFCIREDSIGAAYYLNLILDRGYDIRIKKVSRFSIRLHVIQGTADFYALSRNLQKIDINMLIGTAKWGLLSTLISCSQSFFRHSHPQASRLFIDAYLRKYGQNHLLADIVLAQEWSNGTSHKISTLIDTMARGGLGYLEYFKGRYCGKPFDEFEIRSDGEVFVCCPSFLPYSIGNIYHANSPDEMLTSMNHRKIKDSIVRQDFRYCRWLHCTDLKNGLPLLHNNSKLTYEPTIFRLSYDPTCNLWCPSCRNEKIVTKGLERDRLLRLTDDVVLPMLKKGKECVLNGYGEIFVSKACRRILEAANRKDFPNLSFTIISNGVLFTESEWNRFPGIQDMVRSVRISIDATNKTTYDRIRPGGDWSALQDNLLFLSRLRRTGTIKEFMISFVVQDNNFIEMPDFARLGKRLGCDLVVYEPIMNWNTLSDAEYKSKAVHFKSHPMHEKYLKKLSEITTVIPRRTQETLKKYGEHGFKTLASGSMMAGLD